MPRYGSIEALHQYKVWFGCRFSLMLLTGSRRPLTRAQDDSIRVKPSQIMKGKLKE